MGRRAGQWLADGVSDDPGLAAGRLRRSRRRDAVLVVTTFAATCWLLEADPFGATFARPLENRFAAGSAEGQVDGIIALGGSHARMLEAYRLARLHPQAKVILSVQGDPHTTELLDSDPAVRPRVLFDPVSRSTRENAVEAAKFAQPQRGQRWLLVTSGTHMPRAMGVFRKAGFEVTAWPVNTEAESSRLSWRVALHEWAGLAKYRALGWTDDLYPGPELER